MPFLVLDHMLAALTGFDTLWHSPLRGLRMVGAHRKTSRVELVRSRAGPSTRLCRSQRPIHQATSNELALKAIPLSSRSILHASFCRKVLPGGGPESPISSMHQGT